MLTRQHINETEVTENAILQKGNNKQEKFFDEQGTNAL